MKRKSGYYFVKINGKWEIGKYTLKWWWLFGSSTLWNDEDFEEINEKEIIYESHI